MATEAPDFHLRRARNGIWEPAYWQDDPLEDPAPLRAICTRCQTTQIVNLLSLCQACNFKDKLPSITVNPAPWALREVRRQYGIRGESDRADRERKYRAGTIENVHDL